MAKHTSNHDDNVALVKEAFETLFNQRDYAAAERFWSPNYIQHSAHIAPGREGLFNLIRAAPTGLRYEPGMSLANGDTVMIHGRFSNTGRSRSWIAVDIVRVVEGVLVEHWDVLQDEVTAEESESGLPMFGQAFPAGDRGLASHRRIVVGHVAGRSAILSDELRPAYRFETVPGFEQTYMWAAPDTEERVPEIVDSVLERSALPSSAGSLVQIVTFPPRSANAQPADPASIQKEYRTRLPGLAETFEGDGSQMHATPTLDYAILLQGRLDLEVDDGHLVSLAAGDMVVQQSTRHGWRNNGTLPATIAFIMLGS